MLNTKMMPDLLIKNVKMVDVFSSKIIDTNVAIKDGKYLGFGDYNEAKEIIDAKGLYMSPTFTDGHVHIESSMVSPSEFLKCLIKNGVATIIADPHEIANVCGISGIEYILDETESLPFNTYVMLPSCVPSTPFETSGASLFASDLEKLISKKRVLGLGEMMNFVGTVNRDKDVMDKIYMAKSRSMIVDGHAPLLSGKDLDDYILAGVDTDHECSNIDEMNEKISRGMYIQIREGTAAKNLSTLIKGVNKDNLNRIFFCTDDRHPEDLVKDGSVDNNVRLSIKLGLSPIDAIKMATINPATCYKLKNTGAIAPGYKADFFLFSDLNDIHAKDVFVDGKKIVEDGNLLVEFKQKLNKSVLGKMNIKDFTLDDLKLKLYSTRVNVIGMNKESLITEKLVMDVNVEDGYFKTTDDGVRKILVIERHTGSSRISFGLIKGYDIKNAAVATTISHDSHNLCVIGDNDVDMLNVIKKVKSMGGGMAISSNGKLLGSLKLDIAGLMSSKSLEEVRLEVKKLLEITRSVGVGEGIDPFMTLGFMALPVIPKLKITDRGIFDVEIFRPISIEA